MKLFNITEGDYPRDKAFRTLQVFVCSVCGAKTNKAFVGGWPGKGLRSQCPYAEEPWHHLLGAKKKIQSDDAQPKSIKDELELEIAKILSANKVTDDVLGEPDFTQISNVWYTKIQKT